MTGWATWNQGKEADFIVLDLAANPLLARRTAAVASVSEKLFILSILGDDRSVARTYLAGQLAHSRDNQVSHGAARRGASAPFSYSKPESGLAFAPPPPKR